MELILSLFAFHVQHHDESLEKDFPENQMWKIDYQKRFPVTQVHSMRKNLESLLVDWERETIFHYDLIPLLEILLSRS